MTIDKIDHPWAENGSLDTTLTDEKRDIGWISGDSPDRPTIERLNLLQNTVETTINDVIEQGVKTSADGADTSIHTRNLWTTSDAFAVPSCDSNLFPLVGLPPGRYDICYSNSTSRGRILLISCFNEIRGFDLSTNTDLGEIVTTSQLKSGLPSAMVNPTMYSLCCDEDYIYAVSIYSTQTPVIQSWRISDGTVNTNWPSEGTTLSTGSQSYSSYELRARWVSDGKIAISQPWVDVTSGTADAIVVIDSSDGAELGDGAGDFAGSTGRCVGVCGNGDYAFFAIQETGQATVCSMDLSTYGSTGCGGTNWPFVNVNHDDGEYGDIACAGHTVVTTWLDGPEIEVFDDENGLLLSSTSTDANKINGLGRLVYTGLEWWGLGTRATYGMSVYHLECVNGHNNADASGVTVNLEDEVRSYSDDRRSSALAYPERYGAVYDGRDLWYLVHRSIDGDFGIARLPRINIR